MNCRTLYMFLISTNICEGPSVLGIVLSTGDTAVNKLEKNYHLWNLLCPSERTEIKHNSKHMKHAGW